MENILTMLNNLSKSINSINNNNTTMKNKIVIKSVLKSDKSRR